MGATKSRWLAFLGTLTLCTPSCTDFVVNALAAEFVTGKRVLEVGSRDVNGSVREAVQKFEPQSYLGVDIIAGPGVDVVCKAEELIARFGRESFDVVITTEVVEHTEHWREVFENLKQVCAPGGLIIVTTRSIGFPYHGWPYDFWRYEPEDMQAIFADFKSIDVERDAFAPGVLVRAVKPESSYEPNDLRNHALYSIVVNRRIERIHPFDIRFNRWLLSARGRAREVWRNLCPYLARTPYVWRFVVPQST